MTRRSGGPREGSRATVPPTRRGSGRVASCCGRHRERCLFGRMHAWALAVVDHRTGCPLPEPRLHCMDCDGYCGLDPEDF